MSSASSPTVDLVQTADGTSQILVRNMDDPTGGVPVVCEASNAVGVTRLEGLIEAEEIEDDFVTSEELVLWLIAFSILITNFMYNIFSPAMIISWAATYFFQSFSNIPDLPWTEGCGEWSASLNCSSSDVDSDNALQFWE